MKTKSDSKPHMPTLAKAIRECIDKRDSDMLLYSGPIYSPQVNKFIGYALEHKKHQNMTLILTTYGGDAHAAYRLARFLQSFYSSIRLLIVGPCKSSGTLVSVCANELVFGPFGELGPLDIQVSKKDDLMAVASGLDTFQALAILQNHAYEAFETYMLDILESSQGAISTQLACDVACQLVRGLFQPLTAQLDPQRMGEMERMMTIAKAYGERLGKDNLKDGALEKLIEEYPSHSFIIDFREARTLFKKVSPITKAEITILGGLQDQLEQGSCVFVPADAIILADVSTLSVEDEGEGGENEAVTPVAADSGPNDSGKPAATRSEEREGANGAGKQPGRVVRRRQQLEPS